VLSNFLVDSVDMSLKDLSRYVGKIGAYVWVSPLGEKNHAAPQASKTTTRPMMMLQLY
jgi:hypothetical protein